MRLNKENDDDLKNEEKSITLPSVNFLPQKYIRGQKFNIFDCLAPSTLLYYIILCSNVLERYFASSSFTSISSCHLRFANRASD